MKRFASLWTSALLLTAAAVFISAAPAVKNAIPAIIKALAVSPSDGLFEIDQPGGNATDDATAGDDWQTLVQSPIGGAKAFTGIIDDFCGASGCDDVFTNGSKDEQDISEWVVDPTFNAPDKNEIVNAYAAEYVRPSDGHLILVFGMERLDASGDAQIGFWFLQGVSYDSSTGTFTSTSGGAPHHVAGDTLVLSHFSNGGGLSSIEVFAWVGSGGDTDCGAGVSQPSTLNCLTPGPAALAVVNTSDIQVFWPSADKSAGACNTPPCTVKTGNFFEGAIDLTGIIGGNECFTTFIAESRASDSIGAELKDVVGGEFETCHISIEKHANPDSVCKDCNGAPAKTTYTYHVCNDGVQTLNVNVTDDNGTPGNTGDDIDVDGGAGFSLAPGACQDFEVKDHILPDLGDAPYVITNTVTAVGTAGTATVFGEATAEVAVVDCDIEVTKECTGATPHAGELLHFQGTVTNTGDAALSNVTVTDDHAGLVFGPASLAAGESQPYSGSYTAVLPANPPCESTDTVTATGTVTETGCVVTDTASATCQIAISPSLNTDVHCTNVSAPGGSTTITGSVTNTGDVKLVGVTATVTVDGVQSVVPLSTTTLNPGQTATISPPFVTSPSLGTDCSFDVSLQASATPDPNCGGVQTGSIHDGTPASTSCTIGTSAGIDTSVLCTDVSEPGGSTTVTGTVTNTGNVELTGVTAAVNGNPVTLSQTTLGPGASATISPPYVFSPTLDADCQFDVTLTASGTPNPSCGGGPVSDASPATHTCSIITNPLIDVSVSCTDSTGAGNPIVISGTVTNAGNVPLTGVNVDITVTLNGTVLSAISGGSLAVGASLPFTVNYLGLTAGQCSTFTANASATANRDCDDLGPGGVTDSATTAVPCCVPQTSEGCTPGYWKNHEFAWDGSGPDHDVAAAAGFEFDTLFFKWSDTAHTVLNPNGAGFFDLAPGDIDPAFQSLYPLTLTMDQALALGGGNPMKMTRHTIAALLNLAAGLDYAIPDSCTKTGSGPCIDAAGIKEEFEARIILKQYSPFASDLALANQNGTCPCNVTGCP